MTEKELLQNVRDLARLLGWREYHTRDSRGSTPGFPDLVLVRGQLLIFVELKTERGVLTPEQHEWRDALHRAGAETRIWRPRDWASGEVERVLNGR